uniref:Uncharacterized protein n=1 Tax=Avena sativa TaxID=4498 RepID=A0ACD5Y1V0_AVESA
MTITADRAAHVDFTLPYMSSDIAMVVPLRDQRGGNSTWFFFLFTGFVVWVIEHRDNGEFGAEVEITPSNKGKLTPTNQAGTKGKLTPSNQVGTLVYFGYSTLVFAHREKLTSNLSRLVVIVWVFVVLILQSSYTASLTSMLTVPQVEPAIADYLALLRGTEKVGIMNNSFTSEALTGSGFPQARIMRYSTARSFQEALLNKSIGAIVNETPYFSIFLKTYNDNFTMTGQRNMTGGFGFAFPKGSPYVTDLSRAIMKLTESDEINRIGRKWFGDLENGDSQFTSSSLSLETFWSLFLVTGVTSLVCCLVHLIFNFYADNLRQPTQQITARHSSPREVHYVIDMAGSQRSASSYTSEGSGSMEMEMAILPSDEIEPFTGGQREEAVSPARQRDSSGENDREVSH